jgi:uncharacterized protein (TIGR04551 family)
LIRLVPLLTLIAFAAQPAFAQGVRPLDVVPAAAGEARGVAWLEHHLKLRLRTDLFVNPDLGSAEGPSVLVTPDAAGVAGAREESAVLGSNVRLRYEPVLHFTEAFRLHATFDVLGNMVLGSTPALKPGQSEALLTDYPDQASPEAGRNSARDAFAVPRLYGEWMPLSRVWARIGRMPANFGLGMRESSGDCDDCGYGTVYDGVEIRSDAVGLGVRLAWRWPAEGPASERGMARPGQPFDLSQQDDVGEWVLELRPRMPTPAEEITRATEARTSNGWHFDWGVVLRRRTADLQADRYALEGAPPGAGPTPTPDTAYDDLPLMPFDMDLWMPGVAFHLRGWPSERQSLDLAMEAEFVFGSIGTTQTFPDPETGRDVSTFGAAFRGRYDHGGFFGRLDMGMATGDPESAGESSGTLGVRDAANTVASPDSDFFVDPRYERNSTWEQHIFHRDFHVDRLLFREIIGAVTNAWYVRPAVGYRFELGRDSLELEAGALWATPFAPEATPGMGGAYGVEPGLDARYSVGDHLRIELGVATLLPGAALAANVAAPTPDPVTTVQLDLFVGF